MKSKKILKDLIFFLSILLCMCLTLGLSTAYYAGNKKAKGSVTLNQGIHFDLTNIDTSMSENSVMGVLKYYPTGDTKEETVNFIVENANPNQTFILAVPQIEVKVDSYDFYTRAKININYYSGNTKIEATEEIYNALFSKMLTFGNRWKYNNGYYYYVQENKNILKENLQNVSGAQTIDIFSSNEIILNDFALVNGQGPFGITKFDIEFELEVAEASGIENWNIVNKMIINEGDYDLESGAYVPNTTYLNKYPDYKFKFIIDEINGQATISKYVDMYFDSVLIPDYIVLNGTNYEVTKIGDDAFSGCMNLTSISIPDSVIVVGNSAFNACTKLNTLTIGKNVTTFGNNPVMSCHKLSSIKISEGNKKYFTTDDNRSLLERTSENVVTIIAFAGSEITNYIIPSVVNIIGEEAFFNCTKLTSIIISESITVISDGAFNNCSGLTEILIPDSVIRIGQNAFRACRNLKSAEIGNGVTQISSFMFAYCSGLSSIIIGKNVTKIESSAFSDCNVLRSVTILATTPPTLSGFNTFKTFANIYVPPESVEAYKSASGWSSYASNIQEIPVE